jgi:hypothetical protein
VPTTPINVGKFFLKYTEKKSFFLDFLSVIIPIIPVSKNTYAGKYFNNAGFLEIFKTGLEKKRAFR